MNLKSTNTKWSEDEVNSLVEFILLMGIGEKWPTHQFWCSAGEFVKQRTNSRHLRSGINYTIVDSHNYSFSLIAEVVGYLLKKFKSPVEAEKLLRQHRSFFSHSVCFCWYANST